MRSSMAFMRFNSSVLSCAGRAAVKRIAARGTSTSLHGTLNGSLLVSHNEYNNARPVVKPDWPANQTGREGGGARDEPAVSSGSCGVSKLWDQGSHATATIGAKPAELTGCSSGKGPT